LLWDNFPKELQNEHCQTKRCCQTNLTISGLIPIFGK
jgi:hypothetical protein